MILGVDPGTRKAGFALLDATGTVVDRGITPIESLRSAVERALVGRALSIVALGAGTNAESVAADLAVLGAPIVRVDERETTLRARRLYFLDNPPRGWRRLIPLGMQLPPRPIDDYAAVLIAKRYLDLQGEPPAWV